MKLFHSTTLWFGMYSITCLLFWYETGSIATGMKMGLVSATLKTGWSMVHGKLTRK